jgi:hypothetical protein
MPEISRFFGIIVSMYFADHAPPHFHVRYADQKAVIRIADLALLEGTLSPRALGLVCEWALMHREQLMSNWEKASHNMAIEKIDPLQ